MARYDFASDNTAPAAPEAMAAVMAANTGFTSGYGTDDVTRRAADLVRAMLDADAEVRFVASGTAANAVSLAALLSGKVSTRGLTTAILLSGGNVDPALFSRIIEGRFP